MAEWDPERETYEPEREYRRDYVDSGLGQGVARRGARGRDERGVWSTGGRPRSDQPGPAGALGGARERYEGTQGTYDPRFGGHWRGPSWGPEASEPPVHDDGRQVRGSGPHAGKGPRGYQRSDERIRDEACERLLRDPDIDATDIEVEVAAAEVTLTGTVDSRRARRLAEDVVLSCAGVRDVHNRLKVNP